MQAEPTVWDAYNSLLLGPDSDRLRKLLVRYEIFKIAAEAPGDVVECGVFKGTGALYWLKLLRIFEPDSLRRVVGFDTFASFAETLRDDERPAVEEFVKESGFEGVDPAAIAAAADAAGVGDRLELVQGDIAETAPGYAAANPGFRIALLHLDLDVYHGTRAALAALFPLVVRGGVVLFDEYGLRGWGESDAADEFLSEHPELHLRPVPFATKPTAYLVKP